MTAHALASESSPYVGTELQTVATGFFVDPYGTLVTSYHVLTELGEYDRTTLELSVVVADVYSADRRPAQVEYFDATHDLLVLKTAERPDGFPFLRYSKDARKRVKLTRTQVYTSGFPEGYSYLADRGVIKSFGGVAGHLDLWVTDMEFKPGQSGGPVYLEDGSIVGVVKGSEKGFAKNSFIVPVRYLEHLVHLTPVEGVALAEPPPIGTVRVAALVEGKLPEVREQSRTFKQHNNHCAAPRSVGWRVTATPGWTIDPASVRVVPAVVSSKSSYDGIRDLSESGFTIAGTIRNSGDCVRAFGEVVARDGRGTLGVTASYQERREVVQMEERLLNQFPLRANASVTDQLPEDAQNFRVYFQSVDGKVESLTGPGELGPFKVKLDGRRVEVRASGP